MQNTPIPIIKLEIQSMKHTLLTALQHHATQIDADVQAAIEAYCSEHNLQHIIQKEVTTQLDIAIKEEVRRFFQWSQPGRQAVREAVMAHLDQWEMTRRQIETGAS